MFGKFIIFALLASAFCDYGAVDPRAAIEAVANASDYATRSDIIVEEILLDGEAAPVHVEDAYEMEKMGFTDDSAHIEIPEEDKIESSELMNRIERVAIETAANATDSDLVVEETLVNGEATPVLIEDPREMESTHIEVPEEDKRVTSNELLNRIERAAIETAANATDSDLVVEETFVNGEATPVHAEDSHEMESTDNSAHIETSEEDKKASSNELWNRIERAAIESANTTDHATGSDLVIEDIILVEAAPVHVEDEMESTDDSAHIETPEENSADELMSRVERAVIETVANTTDHATEPDLVIEVTLLDGEDVPILVDAYEMESTDDSAHIENSEDNEEDSTNEIFSRIERAANETEEGDCKANDVCYGDDDCGSGRCLGLFVGKCNCDACFNFLTCSDDLACGGLKNACNTTESRCNCIEGHKANGFPLFIDALRDLCNVRDCKADTDTCFGLPCRSGRCVC